MGKDPRKQDEGPRKVRPAGRKSVKGTLLSWLPPWETESSPPRDGIGRESEGLETEAFICQPLSSWSRVSPATLRASGSRLYLHMG